MKRIIVIGIGVVLFMLILLGVTFLESLKKPAQNPETILPTRVPVGQGSEPPMKYQQKGSDKLLEIVEQRPTPSSSDTQVRNRLITALGNASGTIVSNELFKLEYVKTPNSFEAEIKTIDIASAKRGVVNYLKSQGLSEDGICKLPLSFYLNHEIARSQELNTDEFNPIPDFCL